MISTIEKTRAKQPKQVFYTEQEVADIFRVHRSTILKWSQKRGSIFHSIAVHVTDSTRRYPKKVIDAIAEGEYPEESEETYGGI